MIGIIITGHGEFAPGLLHACHMIAGASEHVQALPFVDGMDLTVLQQQIADKVAAFRKQYQGVVILTDLKGGTPFNVSMMVTHGMPDVAVISGTNLPMVIEGSLLSQFSDSAETLGDQLVLTGQTGIERPQLTVATTDDALDDEEGI